MLKGIETALEGYDERFGIQGEFLLRLSDEQVVEIERVLFAYKLADKEDIYSIEDMLLVLEGSPNELAKVLATKGKELPSGISAERIGIVMRMHKGPLKEIIEMTRSEQASDISTFLVGSDRSIKVFDFKNHDIVSIVTE
jgi:hypothetical protein